MPPKNRNQWQEEAEKVGGKQLVTIINEILSTQQQILSRQDNADRRHEDFLKKAFPGGDFEGHHRYHQQLIDELIERKKFYKTLAEKTIGGLVWSLILGIGYLLWHGFLKVLFVKSGGPM